MSKILGKPKSKVLPLFHSFTGCYSVSSFSGKGKNRAWSTWNSCPDLTEAFTAILETPEVLGQGEVFDVIERYVVLLDAKTGDI